MTPSRRRPRRNSVTQSELARLVGVSQTTVQRVLQGHPYIAADKRHKVLEAMERLNYRPNSAARAMRQGRYGVMGILVVTDTHYLPGDLLLGAAEALGEAGERLAVIPVEQARIGEEAYLTAILRASPVDGLLLHYPDRPVEPLTAALARFNIPAVWLNRRRGGDDVFFDDASAARRATERLIAWGHRRIACVVGGKAEAHRHEDHYSRLDRPAGYAEAMRAASYAPWRLDVPAPAESPGYATDARDFLRRVLAHSARPTALLCYGAAEAGAALSAAARAGRRVPEALSVVGFGHRAGMVGDDGGIEVGLSMLSLDYAALGRAGARALLDKVSNPYVTRPSEALEIPLWWRGTAGPVAADAVYPEYSGEAGG